MTDADQSSLLRSVERQMQAEAGASVRLVDPQPLPSPHVLLRCRVEGTGRSVIVKQVTTSQHTSGQDGGTSHRLLNEWASLAFLGSLPDEGPWPELVAVNREESFVVIEDLGIHPTVERILLSMDAGPAVEALLSMGTSLGRFHAEAYGRTSRFTEMRDKLHGLSPRSDSTYDLRTARKVFDQCLETLQISPTAAFWEEVVDVESAIHGPGPFITLIHADAGPQNFIWTGDQSMLVDFEFATVGNALLDLVSARLGFPHSTDAHTVPTSLVERLEIGYRQELSQVAPEVEDEAVFHQGIADACAHWALVRLGALWRRLFLDEPEGTGDVDAMRSQAFTVYRRFVETVEGSGLREPIAATVDTITKELERKLPGLTEMPVYPALARISQP